MVNGQIEFDEERKIKINIDLLRIFIKKLINILKFQWVGQN